MVESRTGESLYRNLVSSLTLLPLTHSPFSISMFPNTRSSNRTGSFPASNFRLEYHAFAFGTPTIFCP
jgi:hypothetical protein